MTDCLFCRIVEGAIDADRVEDEADWIAIRDINAQAPTHVLVIPRRHVESLEALNAESRALAGELLLACRKIARREGLSEPGYRVVINTNDDGGQTVPHLHLHVLGGRFMRWPPG
jgi:histidine triad (HIT) family protein